MDILRTQQHRDLIQEERYVLRQLDSLLNNMRKKAQTDPSIDSIFVAKQLAFVEREEACLCRRQGLMEMIADRSAELLDYSEMSLTDALQLVRSDEQISY